MPPRRAAPWLALSIIFLLAAAPHARAEGPTDPRIILARANTGGGLELLVACPSDLAPDFTLSIDGGSPASPTEAVPVSAPPSLAIIVEQGAGMAAAGTPHSYSADDALGLADLLLSQLPLGSQVAAVTYGPKAELLAPLGGNLAGARAALATGLARQPADQPADRALSEAISLALAQLRAAPAGPRSIVILAADGPGAGAELPRLDEAIASTIIGLSAGAEAGLKAAAAALGGEYLPFYSEDMAELPGLLDALGARYAAIAAPERLLRVTAAITPDPGRHLVALAGCGGSAEVWLRTEEPAINIAWMTPALAGASGLAIGLLTGRMWSGRRQRGTASRALAPNTRRPTPGQAADGPTERGRRLLGAQGQPGYRLVVWAGDRRLTHELRDRQCVIGNDPGCDLQIEGSSVSALHARLTLVGDKVTLADLDSGSGTSLGPGGPRLPAHQPTEIQDGDEIWLGPEVRIALRRADGG
jgi:hypothetical protein